MKEGSPPVPISPPSSRRLDSWKEIAEYLGRQVRTVQRWEREQELPVYRHIHSKRSSVYAFSAELDAWWISRTPVLRNESSVDSEDASPPEKPVGRSARFQFVLVASAGVVLCALVTFGWLRWYPLRQVAPFRRIEITPLISGGNIFPIALSPDGRYLFYGLTEAGKQSLWLRQIDAATSREIAPAEGVYGSAMFSPDGNAVYLVKQHVLYSMAPLGGATRKILEAVWGPITFSPGGRQFAFWRETPSEESAIMVAYADGTGERRIASRWKTGFFQAPAWSPDGKWIASVAGNWGPGGLEMGVVVVPSTGGPERLITPRKWWAVLDVAWVASGRGLLLLARDAPLRKQQLWYLSYPQGEIRRVTNDVADYGRLALTADSSTLVTIQTEFLQNLWVASAGTSEATRITSGLHREDGSGGVAWTPDGRVLYTSLTAGLRHIWISKADGSDARQLTSDGADNEHPEVCAEGRYVVFDSDRSGWRHIWRMDLDGGQPKQLTTGGDETFPACSPDGKWVVYTSLTAQSSTLWRVPTDGGAAVQVTEESVGIHAISPDGKWIAGTHPGGPGLSGPLAVILPFEGGPLTTLFTADHPVLHWTADSKDLLCVRNQGGVGNVWAQPVAGGPGRQLTHFTSEQIRWFAPSVDRKHLVLSRGTVNRDVVRIRDLK